MSSIPDQSKEQTTRTRKRFTLLEVELGVSWNRSGVTATDLDWSRFQVCKSELYPSSAPTIAQVSPRYRIKAWNCAILVAVARVLYIYTRSYEGRGECLLRLNEGSVTSGGWMSGMRAEPVSMSQVWLLTRASTLSPSLSRALSLSLYSSRRVHFSQLNLAVQDRATWSGTSRCSERAARGIESSYFDPWKFKIVAGLPRGGKTPRGQRCYVDKSRNNEGSRRERKVGGKRFVECFNCEVSRANAFICYTDFLFAWRILETPAKLPTFFELFTYRN